MYTKNEIQNRVVRRIATNYKCRVTVLKKLILILVLVAVKYNDKTHISQKQIRIETVVAFHCSHSIVN